MPALSKPWKLAVMVGFGLAFVATFIFIVKRFSGPDGQLSQTWLIILLFGCFGAMATLQKLGSWVRARQEPHEPSDQSPGL